MFRRIFIILALIAVLTGCAGRSRGSGAAQERHFQEPAIPSVYVEESQKLDYRLSHFWNKYLDSYIPQTEDSTILNGVSRKEIKEAFSFYIQMLEQIPVPKAQDYISDFFTALSKHQEKNPESTVFKEMTDMASDCLYSPVSPLRNEDIYLTLASALSTSEYTQESMRPAYAYDAKQCSLNRFGQTAADFEFTDLAGKVKTMHSVKADYTILNFVNPGCNACNAAKESFDNDLFNELIARKQLAMVCVYVDEDIAAWLADAKEYPSNWYCGYDTNHVIKDDTLYNLRAIPSVYLLDKDKKVIMKDAETQNILNFFVNNNN